MPDEPCSDCDEKVMPDDFAAVAAEDETGTDEQPDARKVRRFGPMLIAPYGKKTGDKRRFAVDSLTNRDLPVAVKWQREDAQGHKTSVVVGAIDEIEHRPGVGPFASGMVFSPDPEQLPRLAEDVNEFMLLADQGVLGPSVDLDDMEFRALPPEGVPADGGTYAGSDEQPEIEVTRGRVSAVTMVVIPAFADVDRMKVEEVDAGEYAARHDAAFSALTAAVRTTGWADLPLADPGTPWDAGAAQQRIKAWAGGDMGKYARAFLWNGDPAEQLGSYKFPIADVIGGQLKIVPKAVTAAAGVLNGAMGGTSLPAADQAQMKTLLASVRKRFDPDQDGDDDRSKATDTDRDEMSAHGLDAATFAALTEELGPELDGDASTFGARFEALVAKLKGRKGISDPDAVAASIGRAKYGKKGMARLRAGVAASKVKPLAASAYLETLVAACLTGDWSIVEEADVANLDSLVAGGQVAAAAPKAWFENPRLDKPTPLTITEDGRVFGHVADWKTCHIGLPGCVRPPHSKTDYAYFHTGATQTDDGLLPIGKLTVGGGHADTSFGIQAATAHYDDAASAVAEVRAGEDRHGIWVAGRIIPGTDPDMVAQLQRSPLSGDWRRTGGGLEMVAAHGVNVGGFPIPRVSLAASGVVDPTDENQVMALVAAGVLAPAQPATTFDLDEVAVRVARAVLAEQSQNGRIARAQTLFAAMDNAVDEGDMARRKKRALLARRAVLNGAKAVSTRSAGGDYQGGGVA
jgi:hypothetical protein